MARARHGMYIYPREWPAAVKAAFVSDQSVEVREVDDPVPGPGEVLVEMAACGICGSDVERVYGSYSQPSMRLGHEPAGTVVQSRAGGISGGDRVFTHHHVPCYSCHYCTRGSETMCTEYSKSNLSPCGLAQRYVVPRHNIMHGGIIRLPEKITFEDAALIEPLACCIRAWRKAPISEGDAIGIIGVGATGMMHAMLAKSMGASKVFCIDTNPFRLEFARKCNVGEPIGATDPDRMDKILDGTENRGVDVAMVATGNIGALQEGIQMVRKGGTAVMFGVPSTGAAMNLDMAGLYSREVTLASSYAASDRDTREALKLMSSGGIDVSPLITHRYPLEDSQRAFEHARGGADSMKIVITGKA
ncbi:L-iditol 2-dehydrogenase/threonine dehydrogenase [Cenarchaeum symbiosum A]|uniref:L-iditol 2-dehydrogenase/threonine dehydrogenase n=1 Tax=Cenarchaeum symbiosum (strain A) TaxID=414004 RepID=A0RV95_CENSY|nr:L-iditol 2-dehydrogenase/threonine dehydrogenase [Cenarchaeum symbiosum A]